MAGDPIRPGVTEGVPGAKLPRSESGVRDYSRRVLDDKRRTADPSSAPPGDDPRPNAAPTPDPAHSRPRHSCQIRSRKPTSYLNYRPRLARPSSTGARSTDSSIG